MTWGGIAFAAWARVGPQDGDEQVRPWHCQTVTVGGVAFNLLKFCRVFNFAGQALNLATPCLLLVVG